MKSMTGYGRGAAERDGIRYSVEIASVNRKQLDVSPVLPRELAELEGLVRKVVADAVSRGRIQVKVRMERLDGGSRSVHVDAALLGRYRESLAELLGAPAEIAVADVLRLPGVLEVRESELEPEAAGRGIREAMLAALADWDVMRAAEGAHLRDDTEARLGIVEREIAGIDARADAVVAAYRQQFRARLEQSGIPLDLGDDRMVREIGLFADRCDTSEERTRLRSHLEKFRAMMAAAEPSGRSMDFLLQEMSREVNTMGAKANDAATAHHVVACKTELEKIREQIQNIE
jgi:uncharacterized protein (TIGR00255 family)